MSTLMKDISNARRKGHNMILIWNNNANCINILNANRPNNESLRLALSKGFGAEREDFTLGGISFKNFVENSLAENYNTFVDSWKE